MHLPFSSGGPFQKSGLHMKRNTKLRGTIVLDDSLLDSPFIFVLFITILTGTLTFPGFPFFGKHSGVHNPISALILNSSLLSLHWEICSPKVKWRIPISKQAIGALITVKKYSLFSLSFYLQPSKYSKPFVIS